MGHAGEAEAASQKNGIATSNGHSSYSKFVHKSSNGISLADPFGECSNGHASNGHGEPACTSDMAHLSVEQDGSPAKRVRRANAIKMERYENGDAGGDGAGSEFGVADDDDRYEV